VVKGENRSLASYLKGRGLFIACAGACRPWSNYFINRVELHCQWDPRVRRGSTGLPECFSWFPGAEVDDARVGSWRRHRSGLYLAANPSHVGVDVDGLACPTAPSCDRQTRGQSFLSDSAPSYHAAVGGDTFPRVRSPELEYCHTPKFQILEYD
jgi:hypothetical protein